MCSSGGSNDLQHYKDYVFAWKSIMAQRMPLVCYKEGSKEIVGANFTFVTHKDDHFVEHFREGVRLATQYSIELFFFFIKIAFF